VQSAWNYATLSAGITTPPQPGNSPYTEYATDLWGNARIGIGNGDMFAPKLNYFSSNPQRDEITRTSTIDPSILLSNINSDPYFDSINKIIRVDLTFLDPAGRESKTLVHETTNLIAPAVWSTTSVAGTWQLQRMRVYDTDGAVINLSRNRIITGLQDITLA
jgi:hypothetical protein